MWIPSSFLLPVALLIAAPVATGTAESNTGNNSSNGCQRHCGGVDIPYPFGIGNGCFRPGFEIICDNKNSGGAVKPRLPVPTTNRSRYTLDVLNVSVTPRPEAVVMLPVASRCYDSSGFDNGSSFSGYVDFNPEGAYRISNTHNELYVLGCNTLAYTKNGKGQGGRFPYAYYAGCVAFSKDSSSARDGACDSIGCCHVQIPPGLTDNVISINTDNKTWSHRNVESFCPCDYAFIVERGNYTFAVSDLTSMPLNKTMSLVLDGAIRDSKSCAEAENKPRQPQQVYRGQRG